jgi:hypothetical protein
MEVAVVIDGLLGSTFLGCEVFVEKSIHPIVHRDVTEILGFRKVGIAHLGHELLQESGRSRLVLGGDSPSK